MIIFMIENDMIPIDIITQMQGLEATLKMKPRVVISTRRVPIGANKFSKRNHVTINCALAYKSTLSQVLVQMADPMLFQTSDPSSARNTKYGITMVHS